MKLHLKKQPLHKSPLRPYLQTEVAALQERVASIEERGLVISQAETAKISQSLFNAAHGSYIGIESSLPSTYYAIYPNYLATHEQYNARIAEEHVAGSKRILIARSAADLRTDAFSNPQDYRKFIAWHHKNGVGLMWIEKAIAEAIRQQFELSTTDVALWGQQYGATFQPVTKSGGVNIRLVNGHTKDFAAVKKYTEAIVARAQRLTIEPNDLPIFSQEVVDRWDEYVGAQAFREKHLAKFLLTQLKAGEQKGRILDAAAGSGYETLALLKQQFDVTANEIDPLWNKILMHRLAHEGFEIETYKYDWRDFSQHFKPVYQTIFAVGNSVCMVIGKRQRQLCLNEFYKLLKPGGKLIIDVRNFANIAVRLRAGEHYYSKGLLYNCAGLGGELFIEDEAQRLIKFNFFDTQTKQILGSTIVQAIKPEELLEQLQKAGFKHIQTYSDLVTPKVTPKAELYTFVATK